MLINRSMRRGRPKWGRQMHMLVHMMMELVGRMVGTVVHWTAWCGMSTHTSATMTAASRHGTATPCYSTCHAYHTSAAAPAPLWSMLRETQHLLQWQIRGHGGVVMVVSLRMLKRQVCGVGNYVVILVADTTPVSWLSLLVAAISFKRFGKWIIVDL